MSLQEFATFCKKKGFFYQSSDIYGGLSGFYDYGHLGTRLKHNFENVWRRYFLSYADAKHRRLIFMAEERIITIPLREAYKKTRVKRTPYAARYVRYYLMQNLRVGEVKLGQKLNEELWKKGTRKPPRNVRVKAIKDGNVVKAELLGFEYKEFIAKKRERKPGMRERLLSRLGPKALKKQEEEDKIEGKEQIGIKEEIKAETESKTKTEIKIETKAEAKKEKPEEKKE